MKKGEEREQMVAAIREALGREAGPRLEAFVEARSARMRLSAMDQRCLELTERLGDRVTAGALAELTGVTSGAITGVLDRLERSGLVRREKDPEDRRQVLVRVLPAAASDLAALEAPFHKAFAAFAEPWSDRDLATVRSFLSGAISVVVDETARLRNGGKVETTADANTIAAPIGRLARASLVVARGASNVTLHGGGGDLYRVRHQGLAPKVSLERDEVTIEYTRSVFRFFEMRSHALDVAIAQAIPWRVAIRGGVSSFRADLDDVMLESFDVHGGAEDLKIVLGPPRGAVPIRIHGGVNEVSILRPATSAARLVVGSGAAGLRIDAMELGAVGGPTRWQSPDYDGAADRYDIEIKGGANKLTVATVAARPRR